MNKVNLRRAQLQMGFLVTFGSIPFQYFPCHSDPLSLAIPPWVGAMSPGDGFGYCWGRNSEFCVVVCYVTRGLLA